MPELPEVETVKRDLASNIVNKKIVSLKIITPKIINTSPVKFKKLVVGKKIISVGRRGKMLMIGLDNQYNLLVHLKMTGQLVLKSKNKVVGGGHTITSAIVLPNKFSHLIFDLNNGDQLFFNDIRKFGWMKVADKTETDKELLKFGPEPLDKDFTVKNFKQLLEKYPSKKIKQLLLEQKIIAGIGNIYADEVCFASGVLPTRIVKTLALEEIKKILNNIKKILKLAIDKRGTSVNNYTDAFGQSGGFKKYLQVYGRAGESCKKCLDKIQKIKLGGRGTHFCQQCQK